MGGGALLAQLLGFCFWGSLWLAGPVAAYSGGGLGKAAVVVDGAAAIAVTDENFVCATLDWWPPEKCDYGTCSWGLTSMLNLKGITLLLINLSGNTTTEVFVTTKTAYSALKTAESTREEYHLTAKDGDIHSQTMLLNGHILAVDSDGHIPELEPVKVAASEPITVDPFSIVFVHIPYFHAPAC
ncbi:hypothetical protein BHE74_00047423, partial [Ensete ventricosum]